MQIEKSDRFNDELQAMLDFICVDSPRRALDFYDGLISEICTLPENPYICRKAKYSTDKNTREMVYKKYTIPYLVDIKNDLIVVLGIFNNNEWEL
jgi:toxin ParE1/3/4